MKKPFKALICTTTAGLLATAALAQSSSSSDQSNPSSSSQSGSSWSSSGSQGSQTSSSQSQQYYQAKNLIGQKATDTQGQKVGEIKDIVFNPQNGETFAAVDVGHDKYALVPWQAVTVSGTGRNEQITLNTTKQSLTSAPTVSGKQYQELNNPTFTQSIYSHFNMQPPSSMGGTSGSSMGGSQGGTSGGSSTSPSSSGTSGSQGGSSSQSGTSGGSSSSGQGY